MRLIELTANKPSFHPVRFNQRGPSYVLGRQKQRADEDKSKPDSHTYNGVGKSLLLYLINYCLGAEANENFQTQLAGWEFTLAIRFQGREVKVTRKASEPEVIAFGAESINVEEFRERLQAGVFPNAANLKFLTFRSLIGAFLRPGKTAYTLWDGLHYSEKPVQKLMRAAHLLGLDTRLVIEKFEMREEMRKMGDISNRFAKDAIIKEYFIGKKDVNLDINELREQLGALEKSLAEFKVADNYHEVEREANSLKSQLQRARNLTLTLQTRLHQVEESLTAKPEVSVEILREAYARAQVALPQTVVRSLEEVEAFHSNLLKVRHDRLRKEKVALQQRLAAAQARVGEMGPELDRLLRFLNDHGALGELLSLSDRANELRNRLQKLNDFKEITKKLKDRSRELKVAVANANVAAAKYLEEQQKTIDEAADLYRTLTRRIYPDKKSGLTVENDEGENQTRFKIEAKIISDASDGINESKIFAYDMTLASLRRNHDVRFICHDSRLFSDIDPRQRTELFQIAYELSNEKDFQYIATVNEDQIDPVRQRLGDERFKMVFTDCVVLELNDDSAEDRLLGVEIDLDYD